MSEIRKWSIKQVINGVVYFNQSFYSTEECYLKFKNLLLLPKSSYIITNKILWIKSIIFEDKKTHSKLVFRNCVFPDFKFYKKEIGVLGGCSFNDVKVDVIHYWYIRRVIPPNIIIQGKEFEYYVSNKFKNEGYEVINNFEKKENDEGIDIIAKKGDELLLIQCKNWEKSVINHSDIKEFLGNCYLFLYKHKEYRRFKKVRRLYITSNSNLDSSARYLLKDYYPFVEYMQVPFKKEKK